jgi:Tol biopolymer transport system component
MSQLRQYARLGLLTALALVVLHVSTRESFAGQLPQAEPLFVYSCGFDFTLNICRVNPDGTGEIMITNDPGNDHDPEVSSAGEIAWTYLSDQVWIMNADGSGRRNLGNFGVPVYAPTWSPDGSKLAFGCWDPAHLTDSGICIANKTGTGLDMVYVSSGATQPDWSPDGQRIAFQSAAGQDHFDIWVLNLQTEQAINITNTDPQDEHGPRWSPDGSKIAYWGETLPAEPQQGANIYLADANGANREAVLSPTFYTAVSSPAWSFDGTQIAAVCDDTVSSIREMCIADVATGNIIDNIELDTPALSESWMEPYWGYTGGAHTGDVDCNGAASSVDSLKILRYNAGLSYAHSTPCLEIGDPYGNPVELWGDLDCSGAINAVDALKALRFVAGLSVSQSEPCIDLGQIIIT